MKYALPLLFLVAVGCGDNFADVQEKDTIEAYEELTDSDEDVEIDEAKFPRLKWVAEMEGGWPFDDAIETLGLGDPEEEVSEIVEAWEKMEYRDMQARHVPGKKNMVAAFAGETSWGDGPEPGSGWYLIRRADVLNILGILGLE